MVKKIVYILFIFCAAITSAVNAQDVTRTTQIDENNGFRWVLVETSNGYGAETIDGKTIIPSIYNRINYVGNAGYRDYFIVEDRYLKKIRRVRNLRIDMSVYILLLASVLFQQLEDIVVFGGKSQKIAIKFFMYLKYILTM